MRFALKFPSSVTLRTIKLGIALAAFAGLLATFPGAPAEAAGARCLLKIPAEYGTVIYRKKGNPNRHLYIICQSHRNAHTGANGTNTVAVQAEIYRIGEWLVKNENVDLLLPEGYFCRDGGAKGTIRQAAFRSKDFVPHSLDDATLQADLNDTSVFVNADKLLRESYHLKLQQVENRKLYFAVLNVLYHSGNQGELDNADFQRLSYLQEKRSAAMLQAIPGAIEREVQEKNVPRKAIFTIGMAHMDAILRFLKEGKIVIDSPLATEEGAPKGLNLFKEHYTVTVILPRVLAEDREAMRVANLDMALK